MLSWTACLLALACAAETSTTTTTTTTTTPGCEGAGDLPCVPKCCPLGQGISDEDGSCRPSDLPFRPYFEPPPPGDDYDYDYYDDDGGGGGDYNDTEPQLLDHNNSYIIVGDPCEFHKYRLEPFDSDDDDFFLERNGSLRVPRLFPGRRLSPREYCLDAHHVAGGGRGEAGGYDVVLPLLCFQRADEPRASSLQFVLYPVGLLISVPFLLATMLVHCALPELRTLRGKTLSCHVTCLAAAYVFLAAVQLGGDGFSEHACVALAFIIQFTFQACFFWLQVMCFDTWWIVRSSYKVAKALAAELEEEKDSEEGQGMANGGFDGTDGGPPSPAADPTVCCFPALVEGGAVPSKRTERKVFLLYSLYAWTCSAALLAVSLTTDLVPTIPSSYIKPDFGLSKCWFNSQEAELNYFYGPVIFVLVTNLIMFIHTSYMLWCITRWNNPGNNEKRCFLLGFSLFFVMGINWVLEVVSWAAGGPPAIWHVTDLVNTLQGVVIFCIYVLEPRVRDLAQRRLWPRVSRVLCKRRDRRAGGRPAAYASVAPAV
ncbi:G-protein coupled receptor Mth2-like [Bacillus rossius redtenbacheri]|uniref:G-protein coupled receptor Mth2-like n=1 Tax=Bacillus rossius redtenbacheri TaxID=93214 RepID=UPI002FDD3B34